MGVHDRDYMQDDQGFSVGGWLATLSMTGKLIGLNFVVFVLWQIPALQGFLADHFMVSGTGLLGHYRVWTLVTSAFSHMGLWHFAFNMLWLWWFGRDLEQIYGRRNFLALYLMGAVGCSLAQVGLNLGWGDPSVPALGASGSVMAVVVVTTLFFPQRTINIWGLIPVPLWLLAGAFVLMDLGGMVSVAQGAPTGIAHAGHLGGAAVGAAFKLLDLRPFAPHDAESLMLGTSFFERLRRRFRSVPPEPALRVLEGGRRTRRRAERATAVAEASTSARVDATTAARVDDLLRKISAEGMDSLTDEERSYLNNVSGRYRR